MKKTVFIILLILLGFGITFSVYYFITPITIITLNGNETSSLNLLEEYQEEGFKACKTNRLLKNKKCINLNNQVKTKNNINKDKLGNYEVTYEIGNKKVTRKVKVEDKTAPIITLVESNENSCPLTNFIEPGFTAIDNYDGDITNKVKSTIKDNQVIYEVTDSSGNIQTIVREFKNKDETKPTISLKGFDTIYLTKGSKYNEKGFTANDNCDKNITNNVKTTGSVDINKVGNYQIKYSVSDSAGNKTEIIRNIKVYEKKPIAPTIVPSSKTIYLTFDDGPGAYTSQLLDTLAYYNVKATFFVTYKPGYKQVIKRAYNEGHTIALHTATHKYSIYKSIDSYFADLNKISNFVKSITGEESKLVRFPGGSSNTVSRSYKKGIMTSLTVELNQRGYKYFDWNISSGDTSTTNTSKIIKNVTKRLGNGKYYIVLQHDIKKASVNAVDEIIEYGQANGYTFAPLNINSPTVHHGLNN